MTSTSAFALAITVIGVLAVLFWPRTGEGSARKPWILAVFGLVLALLLLLPAGEIDRSAQRAVEVQLAEASTLATRLTEDTQRIEKELAEAKKEADLLRERLAEEGSKSSRLEKELDELSKVRSAESKQIAQERADLEDRLRRALSEYAAIERRFGIETIIWNEAALFESGQSSLDCSSRERLSRLVPYLSFRINSNKVESILIEGHTDNIGSMELNRDLSEKRALAVKDYLVQAGVDPARVKTAGMWFQRPAGSTEIEPEDVIGSKNATAALRQKNRRVEVIQMPASSR